jgi:hypothetical protein
VVVRDPPCGLRSLAAADALEARYEPGENGLEVAVTMGVPLARGIFTCVHVWIDGDANPDTGLNGCEVGFRAAVGSRFRPSEHTPPPGVPAPLAIGLLSWSSIHEQETVASGARARTWILRDLQGEPRVEGATLRFTIPSTVLAEANPYGMASTLHLEVETSCGEQPLFLDYFGSDEGLPIEVDGEDRDWSGGPAVRDGGDELFAPFRCLDLLRLRAEHSANRLFLCADTQEPGFAERPPPSPDLSVSQSVTFLAEPVESSYESPRRVRVPRGAPRGTAPEFGFAVKDRTVEAWVPRTGLDGRVRVLAWSESVQRDRVPDRGSTRIEGRAR